MTLKELKQKYPELFRDINRYYPIQNLLDHKAVTKNYAGTKSLHSLIEKNITNQENFQLNWKGTILRNIEKEIGMKVLGATNGYVPNYGGIITLKDNSNYKIELHFYVSFINNYYTIFLAKTNNKSNLMIEKMGFKKEIVMPLVESITVSPDVEFSGIYMKVEKILNKNFYKAKFIPYEIGNYVFDGLIGINNDKNEKHTINNALFRPVLAVFSPNLLILGNESYKIEKLT